MCPILRAQALAAYNPVSGCEMETPRRRFLGYCSLATTILSPHWPALGTYLVCSSVPTAPSPHPPGKGGGGEPGALFAGHPSVTMAT